jgi:hypothetical protein
VTSREVDEILATARQASTDVDPALLQRVRASLLASLSPVRRLAPARNYAATFVAVFAAIAIGVGQALRMRGLLLLNSVERIAIFGALVLFAGVAGIVVARDMRPGSKTLRGWVLLAGALIGIEVVFFSVFHDYSSGSFWRSGSRCLGIGLLCAMPTALAVWLIVRRGYIVARVSTGAAIGTLAGLTGLTALEFHCPILAIPHVVVWHTAVVVVGAGAGALAGWLASRRSLPAN